MKNNLITWFVYRLAHQCSRLKTWINIFRYFLSPTTVQFPKKPIFLVNLTSSPRGAGLTQFFLFLVGMNYKIKGFKVYYIACSGGGSCPQGVVSRGKVGVAPPCTRCRWGRSLLFSPFEKLHLSPILNSNKAAPLILSDEDFLPSLRHVFKKYHLKGNETEKQILQQFKITAQAVQNNFQELIQKIKPAQVILFNGITYPEKVIREICIKHDIKVYTYEVGFRDLSAFFSTDVAPAYSFNHRQTLSSQEMVIVDDYTNKRLAGKFEMGLTKFWDKFESSETIHQTADRYQQVVTIFTNSVYDTSTVFSNRAFDNLFDCLTSLKDLIEDSKNTLFIFRSHPDEFKRVPFKKERVLKTNEQIESYLRDQGLLNFPNTKFIGPTEFVSSYELVRLSKFIIVYNSTIGLESIIMGTKVVLGGNPKYGKLSFLKVHSDPKSFKQEIMTKLHRESKVTYEPKNIEEAKAYLYQLVFEQSVRFDKVLSKNKFNHIALRFSLKDVENLAIPSVEI